MRNKISRDVFELAKRHYSLYNEEPQTEAQIGFFNDIANYIFLNFCNEQTLPAILPREGDFIKEPKSMRQKTGKRGRPPGAKNKRR